ncbi:LmbE-like protein [Acinetobacter sp. NCu2D-2]|uniref:PIG-L deacetylase family protein n=1 Tax=Acinetobacter sp. NCu2D-2 TaxID=1608473 RepID=UPI0007CDB262|nr:PIG-L deacetylase family protein [Acinetobacter sp. NCu2D-2]ANF81770.1 LmbE-like protein [Acinetobacter sp. NCu2D-2]
MSRLEHPIVGDRVIQGEGTPISAWKNDITLSHLPQLNLMQLFPRKSRICALAPHPDDEILGCAGLIQQLDALGHEIVLFAVTNGTASHPNSKTYTSERLNVIRPQETKQAISILNLKQEIKRIALNIQDGQVFEHKDHLKHLLASHLKADDILITTFEHDGHPDHEGTGQVALELAHEKGLAIYRVLIWAWHWAEPKDPRIPWEHAFQLQLTQEQLNLKRQASLCFKSQLEPDSSTGQQPIVSEATLKRLLQPWEIYICE